MGAQAQEKPHHLPTQGMALPQGLDTYNPNYSQTGLQVVSCTSELSSGLLI